MDKRPPRLYYGWAITLALAVTETVSWGIVYYSFAVFLLPMEAELGATRAQLSFAFSLALLVSGAAAIPVGRWVDRHGARALMTVGSLAGAALVWAWSQAEDLTALYVIFAGLGVAMALLLYDPAFAVVTAWFRRDRHRALTAMTLVAGLASTIFVPLSSALLVRLGWRTALVVLAALLLLITTPLHALVLRRRPADLGLGVDGETWREPPAPALAGSAGPPAWRSASFWLLTAAFVFGSGVSVAASVHFIPFLVGQGHPATFAALLAGAVGLMQLPGRLVFGPLSRRLSRRVLNAGALLLQGAAVLLLLGRPGALTLAVYVGVFGMVNGVLTLTRATAVADLFGAERYGSLSGLMAFWITLARAGAPTVVAVLFTQSGGRYAPAWALLAGTMVLAAMAYAGAEHFAGRRAAGPVTIITRER